MILTHIYLRIKPICSMSRDPYILYVGGGWAHQQQAEDCLGTPRYIRMILMCKDN